MLGHSCSLKSGCALCFNGIPLKNNDMENNRIKLGVSKQFLLYNSFLFTVVIVLMAFLLFLCEGTWEATIEKMWAPILVCFILFYLFVFRRNTVLTDESIMVNDGRGVFQTTIALKNITSVKVEKKYFLERVKVIYNQNEKIILFPTDIQIFVDFMSEHGVKIDRF